MKISKNWTLLSTRQIGIKIESVHVTWWSDPIRKLDHAKKCELALGFELKIKFYVFVNFSDKNPFYQGWLATPFLYYYDILSKKELSISIF